jgi:hypothetical protein
VFLGNASVQDDAVRAGDVLKYKVTKFNVDFTAINAEPDNPFEFTDPNMLEDSVLYFKVLNEKFDDVMWAVGFILGKNVEVGLNTDMMDVGPEIDPDLLPETIMLPRGAGVPFFAGNMT